MSASENVVISDFTVDEILFCSSSHLVKDWLSHLDWFTSAFVSSWDKRNAVISAWCHHPTLKSGLSVIKEMRFISSFYRVEDGMPSQVSSGRSSTIVISESDLPNLVDRGLAVDSANSNPSTLIGSKRILGILRSLFKVCLRFSQRVLSDSLLCSDSVGIVHFCLCASCLHFPYSSTRDVGLPRADYSAEYATEGEHSSEKHHSSIGLKLAIFVLLIPFSSCFLLMFYLIKSIPDNRDSSFVVNYSVVCGSIVVCQFIGYLILEKILG